MLKVIMSIPPKEETDKLICTWSTAAGVGAPIYERRYTHGSPELPTTGILVQLTTVHHVSVLGAYVHLKLW